MPFYLCFDFRPVLESEPYIILGVDRHEIQQRASEYRIEFLYHGVLCLEVFRYAYGEPVFITKNGKGDLVVMSVEAYEQLMGHFTVQ